MAKSTMEIYSTRLNDPCIFSRSFQMRRQHGPVKDPFDFVLKFGGEAFKALVAKARHIVDYKFDQIVTDVLQKNPNAYATATEAAVGWFAQYIHARTDLEPDHPALITPFKRGAIMVRLAKLSGLTVEEVRRIIDGRIRKLAPTHVRIVADSFPVQSDPRRDDVLAQLDALADESVEPWEPPDIEEVQS